LREKCIWNAGITTREKIKKKNSGVKHELKPLMTKKEAHKTLNLLHYSVKNKQENKILSNSNCRNDINQRNLISILRKYLEFFCLVQGITINFDSLTYGYFQKESSFFFYLKVDSLLRDFPQSTIKLIDSFKSLTCLIKIVRF